MNCCTGALTSFSDSISYITFLFSEWRIEFSLFSSRSDPSTARELVFTAGENLGNHHIFDEFLKISLENTAFRLWEIRNLVQHIELG